MAIRIMVVDDMGSLRNLFASTRLDRDWQVANYEYRLTNLTSVQQLNPDLIILDYSLFPEGMRWTFLQRLKMDDTTAAIPVLICTTTGQLSPEVESYLAARNITIIHKPFDLDALVLSVRQILHISSTVEAPNLPILVVEDDESIRETTVVILRLEGYLAVSASNGQEALDAVTHGQHRMILLDVMMPVMNGLQFLAAYDQYAGPHTPVIICSAELNSLPAVLPSFVVGRLRKPFEISQLLLLVSQYSQPV